MDDSGNFVVVWTSNYQDGSDQGIFGQRFDASGARRGAEFRVNSTTFARQFHPSVAVAPGGDFVVVWSSPDADSVGIFGQRYDASGSPADAEFQVNSYTTGQQYGPTVDVDGAGNFVVVWTSVQSGLGAFNYGQRFSAAGTRQGGEFAVNSSTSPPFHVRARVARSRDGSFVVAWVEAGTIQARRFDAAGLPVGADFQVQQYPPNGPHRPEVDVDADGDFVITWTGQGQNGGEEIVRRGVSTLRVPAVVSSG